MGDERAIHPREGMAVTFRSPYVGDREGVIVEVHDARRVAVLIYPETHGKKEFLQPGTIFRSCRFVACEHVLPDVPPVDQVACCWPFPLQATLCGYPIIWSDEVPGWSGATVVLEDLEAWKRRLIKRICESN